MKKPLDIDEFISGFPEETQELLEQMRATIKKVAPKAEEVISYGIPAFKMKGYWYGLPDTLNTSAFIQRL